MELIDYLKLLKGETKIKKKLWLCETLSPEAKIYYAAIQGARQNDVTLTKNEIKELFNFTNNEIKKYRQEIITAGWGDGIENSRV